MSHKFAIVSSFLIFLDQKVVGFISINIFIYYLYFILFIFFKIFESKNIYAYFEVYSSEHSSGAIYRTLAGTICTFVFSLKNHFSKKIRL